MIVAVIQLFLLFLLPGISAWAAFGRSIEKRIGTAEKYLLILLSGFVLMLWPIALLTTLGRFGLTPIWGMSFGLTLLFSAIAYWQNRSNPGQIELRGSRVGQIRAEGLILVGVILLAGFAVWAYGQPFEYILGGRDHSVYANTGIHLARTGEILVRDAGMGALPPESRTVLADTEVRLYTPGFPGTWSEGQRITGFTIRSLEEGIYNPHGFHLYPALFGLFFSLGGVEFLFWATLFLNLLGMGCLFMLARSLYGSAVAWGFIAIWSVHVGQVYFTRYPSAEMLLQPLFWGGVITFMLWQEKRWLFGAVISGLAFGLMHLAKLDTVFVPIGLITYFGIAWIHQRQTWGWLAFWIPYLLVSIHAAIHAFQISTIYFVDHLVRSLLPGFLSDRLVAAADGVTDPSVIWQNIRAENGDLFGWIAVMAVVGVIALGVMQTAPFQRWVLPWFRPERRIAILLLLIGLMALQPARLIRWGNSSGAVFGQMSWYFGFWILIFAMIGFLLRVFRSQETGEWFFLGMLTINVLPFFILGLGTAPDHFWTIRRLVPLLFPATILFAILGFKATVERTDLKPNVKLGLIGLAALLVLGRFGVQSRPFFRFVEFEGAIDAVAHIDRHLPEDGVLLMEKTGEGVMFSTPLWLLHDREVYLVADENKGSAGLQQAVDHWQSEGKPVYYLRGQDGYDLQGVDGAFDQQWVWALPVVEAPRDRVPQATPDRQFRFDVYRVTTP